MDGMGNGLGIVYTPHQCWYSDRKFPYWEKSPKVPLGASCYSWQVKGATSGFLIWLTLSWTDFFVGEKASGGQSWDSLWNQIEVRVYLQARWRGV